MATELASNQCPHPLVIVANVPCPRDFPSVTFIVIAFTYAIHVHVLLPLDVQNIDPRSNGEVVVQHGIFQIY